jgi:hypothetical protein
MHKKMKKGGKKPPFLDAYCLFIQVGADRHVTAAFLPLAGNMIIFRAFLRGALRNLIRNFGHVAEVSSELYAVERHHLCSSSFIQFFNLGAIRKRDTVTTAF